MKDFLIIVRRNFVSPIVIAILLLGTTLLFLGETRDAFFISFVIILNTLLAIIQEMRARLALKKLELMSAPHARRLMQNDTYDEILYDQLQQGDTIKLLTGDEIPADGEVLKSTGLEVDESMLTGESASVEKPAKSTVFAASAVVAGNAIVRVNAVGANTKAGAMTATLKRYTPQLTPLQKAISRAITFLTYGALVLAFLIFVVYKASGLDAVTIFKTITSAAVTIVPEGLLLASSLLLAFGSLKLAQAKVLPQKLSAIEAMALLSVLCVDKTGTLTSEEIGFESLSLTKKYEKNQTLIESLVAVATKEGDNATSQAISNALSLPKKYTVIDTLAFSSERKTSGVRVKLNGTAHTILIGAPEFLGKVSTITPSLQKQIKHATSEGQRVLLVALFEDQKTSIKNVVNGEAVGIILLKNALREGVQDTVAYLQKNGVSLRVISGDNPETVKYVAREVGISNPERVITGAELALLNDRDWDKTVKKTTIFARVLPEQKERLIATFQKDGDFTGMVGDGVNDALALKKANLGVAMFSGASASRRVADIVLLNNSFTALPLGMHLGNRIMQAIEVISVLFFHKIIYGIILLLTTLALGLRFPFDPRHITFMNIFLVTLPTIMWTLFPPSPQHRVQPKHFWRDTLWAVVPIASLTGIAIAFSYWLMTQLHAPNHADIRTMTVIITVFFGVYLVFLASRMLGVIYDTAAKTARWLYIVSVIVIAFATFGFNFGRSFFDFTQPNWIYLWPVIGIVFVVALIQYKLAAIAGDKLKQKHYEV
ncbi:MAG TPA: HAD-IC family P-type ATPase [Candidatus Saccharimonadales bacterium]|nr:HAD-IC family P-type ATPase [Candidatus Saccharimonadales bacterium]